MSVDEQLLARKESTTDENNSAADVSVDRVSQLAMAKRASRNQETNTNESPKSLREAVQIGKRKKNLAAKKVIGSEKVSAASVGTAKLLKSAWENLLASFGLSLIWIDLHIFLRQVLGKSMFCGLGEEWKIKTGRSKKESDRLSQGLKVVEPMGVACCNLGCLMIIIGILVLISLIAAAFSSDIFAILWGLVKGIMSGLFSLITG